MKERRKVLLVEQLDSKVGRSGMKMPSNTSRPMSADDIQKAKMRASFMQDKYGECIENSPARNEVKNSPVMTTKSSPNKPETSGNRKPQLTYRERLLERLKRVRIPWYRPPEIKLHTTWRVCEGHDSKEVQVQTQRNQREKQAIYQNPQGIPPNPKEPWDVEMDFDDSLTPEIPTDQTPDPDSPSLSPTVASSSTAVEPDTELLVVLLKHPEVVEALTKGEGKNLTQAQLVALLDMVKKAGTGVPGVLNGLANSSAPEPEPVSLPSPTPPTGWRLAPVVPTRPQHRPLVYLPHELIRTPETQIPTNHYSEPSEDYWTNNMNNYNANSCNSYPRRDDYLPESRTSREIYGRDYYYYSEQRRESDESHEWSRQRQWNHGHQHRGGGGRWRRDNERDYR